MSARVHSFETRFSQFCELFKHCDKTDREQVAVLRKQFTVLHRQGRQLSASDLTGLSVNQGLLKDFFDLGKENFHSFCHRAVELIDGDTVATSRRLAAYVKSQEAFESVRSTAAADPQTRQRLQELLGGLLGIEVGDEFVASVRMENLGRIIGYALSGLAKWNLQTFHATEQLSSRLLKYRKSSVEEYLTERIVEQDVEFVYEVSDIANGTRQVAGFVNESKNASELVMGGQTRAKSRSDSFFVNHAEKKIVMVAATSLNSGPGEQAMPLIKAHQALKALVQTDEINGVKNELFGYSFEVCFCHGGFAPSEQNKAGKQTGSGYFDALGGLTLNQRQALMRSAFLSLLGEKAASPTLQQVLRDTNIHILGTDTEKLYHDMRFASLVDSQDSTSRALANVCLGEMVGALEVLATASVEFSFTTGSKTIASAVVPSVVGAVQNYFKNFPLTPTQELSAAERRQLQHVSSLLEKVEEKLTQRADTYDESLSQVLDQIGTLAMALSPGQLDGHALRSSQQALRVCPTYQFSEDKYEQLQSRCTKHTQDDKKKQLLTEFLIDSLAHNRMPECLKEFINHARAHSAQHPLPRTEFVREFFADVQRMCEGKKSLNSLSSLEDKMVKGQVDSARKLFTTGVSQVIKRTVMNEDAYASHAIWALSSLFDTSLWDNREILASNSKFKAKMDTIAETMLRHAQVDSGRHLNTLLEEVYRSPRRRLR